jgi:perosamine synthetase
MPPTSERLVPISRPDLGDAELEAVGRVLRSGWITQGPEVERFEAAFAKAVGAPFACAVSSGTAALHLAVRAAGVAAGDEVVTVSHSFIATANAVRYCDATPVFVDVDPDTLNLDPHLLEEVITPRTRAILCVHQLGMPCELEAIVAFARSRGIVVIEDAACAAGSEILWRESFERIGRPHGDAACFSFHPRKVLTTGDGGMITTARPEWDRLFRLWRQHGMDVPAHVRHGSKHALNERYLVFGFNYRLSDLQAAVGLAQLGRLSSIVAERRRLAARYAELLAGLPDVTAPHEPPWARSNWQSYAIRLAERLDVQAIRQRMLDQGIATRPGVTCAHREPAYGNADWSCGKGPGSCGCPPQRCQRLRRSEMLQDSTVLLPLFPGLGECDQDAVVSALRRAVVGDTSP